MFANLQYRVTGFVTSHPCLAATVVMGSIGVYGRCLQTALEARRTFLQDEMNARRADAAAGKLPRYGEGRLLEGRVFAAPALDLHTCERLGAMAGFMGSDQRHVELSFAELVRACGALPRTVDQQRLQGQLDDLRKSVESLSGTRYKVHQREQCIQVIQKLWNRAQLLRKRVVAHYQVRTGQPAPHAFANSAVFALPVVPSPPAAVADVVAPSQPRRLQPVVRQELPAPVARQRMRPPAVPVQPVVLHRERLAAMRRALDDALRNVDGNGRLTDQAALILGTAITDVVGGNFPTHPGHRGHRDRLYTITNVLNRAIEYMTPWHGAAVMRAADAHLRASRRP